MLVLVCVYVCVMIIDCTVPLQTDYYRPEQLNEEKDVMVVEDEAQDHYLLQWPTNYDSHPEQAPTGSGWRHGSWHCFMIFLVIITLLGVGFFCCQSKDQVCAGMDSDTCNNNYINFNHNCLLWNC